MSPMGGQAINVGSIIADLQIDSGHMERGLANARTALQACGREVRQLIEELRGGTIGFADYQARATALGQTMADLQSAMRTAYQHASITNGGLDIMAQKMGQARSAASNLGMAMMQLGYMADDVRYGFGAIVNNIGPLATNLTLAAGASMKMGGAIGAGAQIGAVALYELYERWDDLMKLMGTDTVRTEAEEMERLAQKTRKTADETERLNKYKREQADLAKFMEGKTDRESERSKAVEDALRNAGAGNVMAGIIESKRQEGTLPNLSPADRKKIRAEADKQAREEIAGQPELAGNLTTEEWKKRRARELAQEKAQKAQQEAAVQQAQGLMNRARNGDDGALAELERMVEAHPHNFGKLELDTIRGLRKDKFKDRQQRHDENMVAELDEESRKNYEKQVAEEAEAADDRLESGNTEYRKAKQRKKQERRENARRAEDTLPGLKEITEDQVARGLLTGASPEEVTRKVKEYVASQLKASGKFDDKQANQAAEDLTNEAGGDVQRKVINRMLNGRGDDKDRKSEVFDASDLNHKIQSAVGSNDHKETMGKFDQVIERLTKLVEKPDAFRIFPPHR